MLWFVVLFVLIMSPVQAACVGRTLGAGEQAPWDLRDALARRVEAEGQGLGLPRDQIARLAFALRLGRDAAAVLTAQDREALARIEGACDPPQPVLAEHALPDAIGFDLRFGWPHLLGAGVLSGLALTALVWLSRRRARAGRMRKRYFCRIDATLHLGPDQAVACRVTDVSVAGARLSVSALPAGPHVGPVILDFGTFQMAGSIVSQKRAFAGLAFERPLTRGELLHLVRPEKYPPPARPTGAAAPQPP